MDRSRSKWTENGPHVLKWTEWINVEQNRPKCYTDVPQQKYNNNKYYTSGFKYYSQKRS